MTASVNTNGPLVAVKVEFFGSARKVCGRRHVRVDMPETARTLDVCAALSKKCPELVGSVIEPDGDALMQSYTMNLNGTRFVDDEPFVLKPDDVLLIFSSQAGG